MLIINYYEFNYTLILILSLIITNIIKYTKEINYLFNKFLLERYLDKYIYKKSIKITKLEHMYKEKYHIVDDNCETDAMWIDIDNFVNGELKMYPEEIFKYLK